MKKSLYYSIMTCGLLGLASCASNEPFAPQGDGATFRLCLPADMAARGSFGDGTDNGDRATLNNLQYTVYEVTGEGENQTKTPLFDKQVTAFAASQTEETVQIPLAKGKSYQVVFYADDSSNTFASYNGTTGTLSVEYDNAKSNTAGEDAFIGKSIVFKVEGAYSETITLSRPFAQLNWGTDDLDADVLKEILPTLSAEVTVSSGLYSQMDVLTGTVSNEVSGDTTFGEVAYDATNKYFVPQTFPVVDENKDYSLIAMNYLLTGEGTIDCELTFSDTDLVPVTVSGANVMPNYRTNIYGSLLTAPGTFNILINNDFGGAYDLPQVVKPWDGTTLKAVVPTSKEVDGTTQDVYEVKEPSELAWIASQINSGDMAKDSYIQLSSDVDLNNKAFTPIGYVSRGSSTQTQGFTGTFDGQGHTIMNLNYDNSEDDFPASLLGTLYNATVKNVNIDGGTLVSEDCAGAIAGATFGNTVISNCTASNMTISGKGGVGGIVGRAYSSQTKVINCTNNSKVVGLGSAKTGGIVGIASATADNAIEISNCINNGPVDTDATTGTAGIVGYVGSNTLVSNCTNNAPICANSNANKVAGIVGYLNGAGPVNIVDCTNTGDIKSSSHAGGIYGMVGSYGVSNISGCKNTGNINGAAYAGGIAAQLGDGDVESCTNEGAVTAGQVAGGVVGAANRGNVYNCLGGQKAITGGTYAGRILGAANTGSGYRNKIKILNTTDSYADGLGTVGSVGIASALSTLEVVSGELIGSPKRGGNGGSAIIIDEGASWDIIPNASGTYYYRTDGWAK